MTLQQFKSTFGNNEPPVGITASLSALWYAGKGDWEQAHAISQDLPTREGSWVHAWLHRQEGDEWNANYWYNRAGKTMPSVPVEEEWERIAAAMLNSPG